MAKFPRPMRRLLLHWWVAVSVFAVTAGHPPSLNADWDDLRSIPVGERVRIVLKNAQTFDGEFRAAGDSALTIRQASTDQEFSREEIVRVSHQQRSRRLRNALIGLGVGAAGGLAAGSAFDARDCGSSDNDPVASPFHGFGGVLCFPHAGKALFTPVGGAAGLAVGALLPTGGWRQVYRAEPR